MLSDKTRHSVIILSDKYDTPNVRSERNEILSDKGAR